MNHIRASVVMVVFFLQGALLFAQQTGPGVLNADELKHAVPAAYFFRGQSAPVQLRNSGGFHIAGDKLFLAALVDTSGYAADVAARYQGLLITEEKITVEGSELPAGAYGFGFLPDGKFVVMDVGAHDVMTVSFHMDKELHRAVPLKVVADQGSYRFYAGKKWVGIKVK